MTTGIDAMQRNDTPDRRLSNIKRKHRYVYTDLQASNKSRDVYLKKGAECAAFFNWVTTRGSCIPQCGLVDISLLKLERATGMDSDTLAEVLSELVAFGIVYDQEAEVLFIEDIANQYIAFSRHNKHRSSGIENHLSTIPDSFAKERFTTLLGWSDDSNMKGIEGAASQVTSEVTSQVTSKVPFGGES